MASGESIVSGSSESYRDCDKRFDYRTDSSVSDYDYECDQNFTLLLNDSAAATGPDLIYLDFLDSSRFWIQRVLVPTILIIGVIGNLVTIVIMTRRRMRSSTNSYLAALATFDMIYLVMIFLLSFAHYPNIKSPSYYYYWILWPFSVMVCDASSNISIWLTVTFTIERYIAVCHPMRGKVICTESRAKKVIVCVFVVCFAFTIPTPFEWVVLKQIDPDTNATFLEISFSEFGQNDLYKKVYYWLTVVLFVIVPFCLLSIFNAFLIRSVHVSQKRRNCMTQKQTTKSNTAERDPGSTQEARITVMLIAVVILFFVCQLPTAITLLYSTFHDVDQNSNKGVLLRIFGNIFNFLMAINAAGNFVLYCLLSQKYRRTFLQTFCPHFVNRRHRMHNTNRTTKTLTVFSER